MLPSLPCSVLGLGNSGLPAFWLLLWYLGVGVQIQGIPSGLAQSADQPSKVDGRSSMVVQKSQGWEYGWSCSNETRAWQQDSLNCPFDRKHAAVLVWERKHF